MVATFFSLLWSCRPEKGLPTVETCGIRDKVEKTSVISIDDNLPPMHSTVDMFVKGDTLIINDYRSQEKQFHAYDITEDRYLGSFGKYGNGPGEMANIGGVYLDDSGRLFCRNSNHMILQSVDIDSALNNPDYKASKETRLDLSEKIVIFITPTFINDTTVLCSLYCSGKWGYTTHLGHFNPKSGEAVQIDTITSGGVGRSGIAVDKKRGIAVETGMTHDRIRIFDLDGNLRKTVLGPSFKEEHDGRTYYFSSPLIAGDNVLANYNGEKDGYGKDIVIMDIDGRYVKTLRFDAKIMSMAYHPKSKRLYLCNDGETQFGYIKLDL